MKLNQYNTEETPKTSWLVYDPHRRTSCTVNYMSISNVAFLVEIILFSNNTLGIN